MKRELVDLSIEEGNQSFRQSGIGQVKLRLVHAYQTDYVEEGAHFDHVWRFADKGDGYMDEIHGLRDKYKADVAILIVDDPKGCGLATRVYADAEEAFAVVHHECAAASYSLAHEIGHLIGARHDLNLDKNLNPFPYGHGYVNGTKWRDIMSYKESCGGCPRLPVWSSPDDQDQWRPGRVGGARQRPRDRRAGRPRRRLPVAVGFSEGRPTRNVIPGFIPGIQRAANSQPFGWARSDVRHTQHVAPDALSAREMGRQGERGADARLIQGNADVRAPLLQGGSPGTADDEAISSRSFFPGVASATGATILQPSVRTIGKRVATAPPC